MEEGRNGILFMKRDFKYIYGPVSSWRLGVSLGIDPISRQEKVCTFDCVYCQLGKTSLLSDTREDFVAVRDIMREMVLMPSVKIDFITFAGRGEPTLAKNLGQMISAIKTIRKERVAVITNASLLDREDVQNDLLWADLVVAKLDACSDDLFKKINQPMEEIKFDRVLNALQSFRRIFTGKLALQIMFIEQNKAYVKEIVELVRTINPDEVEINTPLRLCKVKPLRPETMQEITAYFNGFKSISVYEAKKIKVDSISKIETLKRRGKNIEAKSY